MENSFSHCEGKGVDVSQGPTKKRKGDVRRNHGVNNTPLVLGETTHSISIQGNNVVNHLDFMIELVLHKSFLGLFEATRNLVLVCELPCCIQSFCLLFIPSFKINRYEVK
jgi:hypothetical protein